MAIGQVKTLQSLKFLPRFSCFFFVVVCFVLLIKVLQTVAGPWLMPEF